jgi:glycosyltransferase involved in cell wall biosynthesis
MPDATLNLAVDAHDLVRDGRGIGTYVRAVLSRFAQRDDVKLTLVVRDPFALVRAASLRAVIAAPHAHVAARVPRTADVVWHPWNGTFLSSNRPAVATIHDVVPFAFPESDAAKRSSQQAPFRRTAERSRLILCDSAFTMREVTSYLDVAPERMRTIPLGVDPAFTPGSIDALPEALRGRRFVLHVGAHDAHKNVATLIDGMRRAFPHGDVPMVFTRPAPAMPDAVICANTDRATLLALYRAATIVAVPSLYEGFGLPVVEAMACGAPVLASRAASLPEVGGDAVRYIDRPSDPIAWAEVLSTLARDDDARAVMAQRGLARAAMFTWERCAQSTLAMLREAAA